MIINKNIVQIVPHSYPTTRKADLIRQSRKQTKKADFSINHTYSTHKQYAFLTTAS